MVWFVLFPPLVNSVVTLGGNTALFVFSVSLKSCSGEPCNVLFLWSYNSIAFCNLHTEPGLMVWGENRSCVYAVHVGTMHQPIARGGKNRFRITGFFSTREVMCRIVALAGPCSNTRTEGSHLLPEEGTRRPLQAPHALKHRAELQSRDRMCPFRNKAERLCLTRAGKDLRVLCIQICHAVSFQQKANPRRQAVICLMIMTGLIFAPIQR